MRVTGSIVSNELQTRDTHFQYGHSMSMMFRVHGTHLHIIGNTTYPPLVIIMNLLFYFFIFMSVITGWNEIHSWASECHQDPCRKIITLTNVPQRCAYFIFVSSHFDFGSRSLARPSWSCYDLWRWFNLDCVYLRARIRRVWGMAKIEGVLVHA